MKGICEICTKQESKYKCPTCLILYCSLGCYQQHKGRDKNFNIVKELTCEKKPEEFSLNLAIGNERQDGGIRDASGNAIDDDDWVSPERLQLLGHSEEVKNKLRNKHLQKLLIEVDSSPNPGEKLDEAMQIPIFTEFVDICMKIIEEEPNKD